MKNKYIIMMLVMVMSIPLLASSNQNSWSEVRPSFSAGIEVTSSTMLVAPIAVGLQWNNIFGAMSMAALYVDEKIPIATKIAASYNPDFYWELSLGIAPRIYLTKKSFGNPLKRLYIVTFLGVAAYPNLKSSIYINMGVDFR